MRKLFYLALAFLLVSYVSAHSETLEAVVSKEGIRHEQKAKPNFNTYRVIDSETNKPIPNAKVLLPKENYSTYTDANGVFELNAKVRDNSILAIEKNGYRPFSLTLQNNSLNRPFTVKIDRSSPFDVLIDSTICHLGDNAYSNTSANSHEFKSKSAGNSYNKTFNINKQSSAQKFYFCIGSLIGLDTKLAKALGQNFLFSAYSSPAEIYLNGTKVSELHLNGDNLRVKLPNNLVRNGANNITLKTGKNIVDAGVEDYDDIEFMNLSIITE